MGDSATPHLVSTPQLHRRCWGQVNVTQLLGLISLSSSLHWVTSTSPPATQVCDKVKLEKQLTDNVNTRMSVKLNLLHIFSRRRSGILGGKVLFYSFISPLKVSLMYPPCYRCLKSGSKPRHYHQQSPCPGAVRAAAALRRPGAEPRGESGMWHFRCGGHRHSWTRRPGAGIPRLDIS